MSDSTTTDRPTLLVANRGEIAVRVLRTARDLGMRTVAVAAADDRQSLHAGLADVTVELPAAGTAAYLDIDALVTVIRDHGVDLVHPGYGFLAESPAFVRAVGDAGAVFVGPDATAMETLGDKDRARDLAAGTGVPTAPATGVLSGPEEAEAFLREAGGPVALKAVAGGGGRGIVIVDDPAQVADAWHRAGAEARAGFGDDRLFAEQWITGARHIEVQALGMPDGAPDTAPGILVLGDRDCSLQCRRQKFLEIAPADLPASVRADLHDATTRILSAVGYRSLATVEFLVTGDDWYFLEVNPRIQVEHTVTEEVTGLDLVAAQLQVATGAAVDLTPQFRPAAAAVEARISAGTPGPDGLPRPATGVLTAVDLPTDRAVRVDTWVRTGTTVTGVYDPLLAKITASGGSREQAVARLERALGQSRFSGVETTLALQRTVLADGLAGTATTGTFDERAADLTTRAAALADSLSGEDAGPTASAGSAASAATADPATTDPATAPGETLLRAPLTGTVVSLNTDSSTELCVLEAMKMHHGVTAPAHISARLLVTVGDLVQEGQALAVLTGVTGDADTTTDTTSGPHPGIAEAAARHAGVLDDRHPEDVAKVHRRGRRTARENLDDLIVPGSFTEYGSLAIAAQRSRRSHDDLVDRTRADGLVGGIGTIDTGAGLLRAVIMSYDYMVLAGTQGARNHHKTDRLLDVARRGGLPVVFFTEGGGGRPGDTDIPPSVQLDVATFATMAGLRGQVPLVAVVSGRCFAGNAALAGLCDVIIATQDANLGMGGPAMIAGGGLGTFPAEAVGPASVHRASGAVDLVVDDDAAAVAAARQFLGYHCPVPGDGVPSTAASPASSPASSPAPDDARLVIPADRMRAFRIRDVLDAVVDPGSLLELRDLHAPSAVTALARVEGRPVGIIANDNHHLGGAIDVDAARSFTTHMRLVESMGIPLVSMVDTPGFMVGPAAEEQPGVRAFGDLFVTGAQLTVPVGAVILRKAYGLGAMAMTAGHFHAPRFTVAWPSGEMGPMGLEGAVELGFARELAAAAEEGPAQRDAVYSRLLDGLYAQGRAMTAAENFDIDDVIDPADTRAWIGTLG